MKSTNGALRKVLVTAAIAVWCAGSMMTASAAPESDQFSDVDCSKEQDTTIGMKVCAGRELAKTERALKAQQQKMLKTADKSMRKSLNKWFKASDVYADAMCDAKGQNYAGGSMQSLVISFCLNSEYGRQLKELKDSEDKSEGS